MQVSSNKLKILGEAYGRLRQVLAVSNEACTNATDDGDLAGITGASEKLRKVADEFKSALEAAHTLLPDRRKVFIPDLEALHNFAIENGKKLDSYYKKVTIENGRIVGLDASRAGVRILKSLNTLTQLRVLDVSENPNLITLSGIPNEKLEEIDAEACGLTGDLSALDKARRLKDVRVNCNLYLESLAGVSTESLEIMAAENCNLSNDNSIRILILAEKLKIVDLKRNRFKNRRSTLINTLRKKVQNFSI